ncbi:MAG: endosialidase [Lachnospiraceae bacterium]|nr:endosialidase [Lachnospiraceae bacterium]
MAVIKELLRAEKDSLSFGDYSLESKSKLEDFKWGSDVLKVKTFKEITRLEKNGSVVYESVPGTSVIDFKETEEGLSFTVEGPEDAMITVGLAEDADYEVKVGDGDAWRMKTNLGGKLAVSVELAGAGGVDVVIRKV